jgi:hypothetical protein
MRIMSVIMLTLFKKLIIHNPDSLSSVIVDLSQVFTRRKVLNNLSSEHAVVGKVRRIRITLGKEE